MDGAATQNGGGNGRKAARDRAHQELDVLLDAAEEQSRADCHGLLELEFRGGSVRRTNRELFLLLTPYPTKKKSG